MENNMDESVPKSKEHDQAFKELADKYRRLQANIPGMVYMFALHSDGTCSFLYVNAASRELFDIEPDDLIQKWTLLSDLIHPDDRERFEKSMNHSAKTLLPFREKLRHIVKGEVRWYDCMSRPEAQPNGDILFGAKGLLVMAQDISERKRIEHALRESEERFRSTFEQAAVGIAHVGLDGKWLRVNQRLCDIVGYSREELMNLSFQDITYPDDLETDLDYVRQMLKGEIQTYTMEKRYIRKNGSLTWINLTVSLVKHVSGEPNCFISVIEDISARKDAEKTQQAHL